MFSSVLIANRGEIAVRIARTARRMGLRTIAVYSEADAHALHVRACDEALPIGPAPAAASYLVAERLIAAARRAGADCIHPGYGFLSENAEFAAACAAAGIAFVGPPPDAIRAMGLKDRAKALMTKAGVPVVPGYHGERQDPDFLKRKAYETGYPVLIKAVAGGGGKGMRRVDKHSEFETALTGATREASAAFGDPRVLIEKYVTAPRHVEIQVFADAHGNTVHLFERDCSIQRRHQKVIEEAPSPAVTPELRAKMGAVAVKAAAAVHYVGAGTCEFLLGADGRFYFLEMNTRLQVEHPVTEMIYGLDLVSWQLDVAEGKPLPLTQAECDARRRGWAIECRVYAEDPVKFLPSPGRITHLRVPHGPYVRDDSGCYEGAEIPVHYDPMISKLVVWGEDRPRALARMTRALDEYQVRGIETNLPFHRRCVRHEAFARGDYDTGFIGRNAAQLAPHAESEDDLAAAMIAAVLDAGDHHAPQARAASTDTNEVSAWRRQLRTS
jgi:acetyl-CoA carboxylase biotin carboxylase subunit